VLAGSVRDLVGDARKVEITLEEPGGATAHVEVEGDAAVDEALRSALARGARVESVIPKRETLEEVFVRTGLMGAASGADRASDRT